MFDTSNSQRPTILKDPYAVLDYSFDFTDWLEGEAITQATGSVAGTELTLENPEPQVTGGVVTFRVGGGKLGFVEGLTCQIQTATKKDARTMFFRIVKR